MHTEDSYKKHLNFMRTVKDLEDIEASVAERQYCLLLDFIPNGGKLYKYRSLQGKSFSYIYDSLKNGYLWIPTADSVPKTVASALAKTDTSRELTKRVSRLLSWKTAAYWAKVKPSNWVMSLPVLKDAMISTNMGAYRNTKIRIVMIRFTRFIRSPSLLRRRRTG